MRPGGPARRASISGIFESVGRGLSVATYGMQRQPNVQEYRTQDTSVVSTPALHTTACDTDAAPRAPR